MPILSLDEVEALARDALMAKGANAINGISRSSSMCLRRRSRARALPRMPVPTPRPLVRHQVSDSYSPPSISLFRMQPFDVIAEGPFQPKNNMVMVPDGPGLGVTLSPAGLARCHQHFKDHGPYDKFRDPDRLGIYRRLPLA